MRKIVFCNFIAFFVLCFVYVVHNNFPCERELLPFVLWCERERERESEETKRKGWENFFFYSAGYFIFKREKMIWSCCNALQVKTAIVAPLKKIWKSLDFREAVGIDFLGLLSKKWVWLAYWRCSNEVKPTVQIVIIFCHLLRSGWHLLFTWRCLLECNINFVALCCQIGSLFQ